LTDSAEMFDPGISFRMILARSDVSLSTRMSKLASSRPLRLNRTSLACPAVFPRTKMRRGVLSTASAISGLDIRTSAASSAKLITTERPMPTLRIRPLARSPAATWTWLGKLLCACAADGITAEREAATIAAAAANLRT